ncbi:hypothetical protein BSF41_36400 [Flavobacterium sp. ACN2]|nr:hypothetical protein BSF41_36400 [Flavobacterium sp. ACN2]
MEGWKGIFIENQVQFLELIPENYKYWKYKN